MNDGITNPRSLSPEFSDPPNKRWPMEILEDFDDALDTFYHRLRKAGMLDCEIAAKINTLALEITESIRMYNDANRN